MQTHTNTNETIQELVQSLNEQYGLKLEEHQDATAMCTQLLHQLSSTLQENVNIKQTYEYRYRLVAHLMNDVLFEFHLKDNLMCDSTNWDRFVDGSRFIEGSINRGIVYHDDVNKFLQFFSGTDTMNEIHEILIRIRMSYDTQDYTWTSIKGIILPDVDGTPCKIIGSRTPFEAVKEEMDLLSKKARIDGLTSLYNKATTQQLVESIIKEDKPVAFLMCDIDDFKGINDSFGHPVGDQTLKCFASTITSMFRKEDIVGRVGGDEFLAVFPYEQLEDVIQRAKQLLQTINTIKMEGHSFHVTGSVGIARYPEDGTDFATLFANADKALYQAKHLGKNQYELYNG